MKADAGQNPLAFELQLIDLLVNGVLIVCEFRLCAQRSNFFLYAPQGTVWPVHDALQSVCGCVWECVPLQLPESTPI